MAIEILHLSSVVKSPLVDRDGERLGRVEDLIVRSAEEYVSKAVQVATDRDYRRYVTDRIAQASDVLFNDLEAVREHERFFEDVLAKHDIGP